MKEYFIRRILLIPPTLLGITLLVFVIMRLVPGGPMEEDLKKLMGQGEGKATRSREQSGFNLKPEMLVKLAGDYDRDKPNVVHYLEWLGVMPRDISKSAALFEKNSLETEVSLPGTTESVKVTRRPDGKASIEGINGSSADGWKVRIQSPADQLKIWKKWVPGAIAMPDDTPYRAEIFQSRYAGLLQGKLGSSMKYQEPVSVMVRQRMPISVFYGVIEIILIYGICLPLGIVKAIKHRSWLDNISSIVVFAGYAVPGYALGALLVVYVCAKGYFPMGGFVSENFSELGLLGQIKDLLVHAAMPLVCYLVGAFAMMTMMVKNSLMDHLAADYVRTAIAKGVSFRRAVFRHALLNSLIPLATTVGGNVSILVAGSMFIEKIFDINGFGLLQFNALIERDEYVIMGTLTIAAFLMLVGNMISDMAVALVDPKISFE
ncbi:MAG: ABC transporter permease subunit [Akkermansiaceae bacterium]